MPTTTEIVRRITHNDLFVKTKAHYEEWMKKKIIVPKLLPTILCLRSKLDKDTIDIILKYIYPQYNHIHAYKEDICRNPKLVTVKFLKNAWVDYGKQKNEELSDLLGMPNCETLIKTSSLKLCKEDLLKLICFTDDLVLINLYMLNGF